EVFQSFTTATGSHPVTEAYNAYPCHTKGRLKVLCFTSDSQPDHFQLNGVGDFAFDEVCSTPDGTQRDEDNANELVRRWNGCTVAERKASELDMAALGLIASLERFDFIKDLENLKEEHDSPQTFDDFQRLKALVCPTA
ncbi:unnamed protein product, partial [marine sediment metagenome]